MQGGVYGINAIAFKYKDGVIAAVDTGATYGRMALSGLQTIFQPLENSLVVFSGMLSDVQFLKKFIKQEIEADVGRKMDPQGIHKMIQRILYQKRSEMKPMMVSVIVCGMNQKKNKVFNATDDKGRFIGVINSKGNFWFDDTAATSFSENFALPLLRNRNLEDLSKEDAVELMEECFRIMCYKDCRATNTINIGIIDDADVSIFEPRNISTDWMVGKRDDEILIE